MFFILSKILGYLTQPMVIITFTLVLSLFLTSPRIKKRLQLIGISVLLFFTNDFIANEVALWWEVKPIYYTSIQAPYNYGIILTGVTKSEGPVNDRVFLNRGADRITHAVELYRLNKIKKILVSGGNGNLTKVARQEADNIAAILKLMLVPDSVIVIENQSRNTHESALAVKKILGTKATSEKCLLITSAFHIRRSVACFKKVGVDATPFSTEVITHKRKFDLDILFIPKNEAMGVWQTLIREWVGMFAYKLAGYI
ncbi:MAG: YdcF family protein [Flammeovirgaceae bacterium]